MWRGKNALMKIFVLAIVKRISIYFSFRYLSLFLRSTCQRGNVNFDGDLKWCSDLPFQRNERSHTHLLLIDNKSNYIINMADRMIETSGEKEMKNISIANNLNHVALISMAMKLCCKTSKGKKMEYVFQNERKQKLLWKWKENRKSNRNWSQHGNVQGAWIRHCGYQTPTKAFGHIYNTSNRNKCAVHFIYMRIYNTNMHDLLRMHKHIICGVFSSSPTSLDRIWNWQNKLCTFHWKIE